MMGEQRRGGKGTGWRALGAMVPADHILRRIDGAMDLGELRDAFAPHYSQRGRPSIAPELLIRMALIGRLYGITSERRLCEEVRFNLAYRWFCRLPLDAPVPHHSTFSKNRHGRFRDAGVFRILFEQTVRRCADAGLIARKDAAIDASFVAADASWQRKMRDADMAVPRLPRPVHEWLADQADAPPQEHGVPRGKPVEVSRTDPASAWSARTARGRFGYAFNVLIDIWESQTCYLGTLARWHRPSRWRFPVGKGGMPTTLTPCYSAPLVASSSDDDVRLLYAARPFKLDRRRHAGCEGVGNANTAQFR